MTIKPPPSSGYRRTMRVPGRIVSDNGPRPIRYAIIAAGPLIALIAALLGIYA